MHTHLWLPSIYFGDVMERMSVWGSGLLMLATTPFAVGDELGDSAFFKDSKTQLLNRNFFFNRDFRDNASTAQSYRQEWAQGLIGTFNSGFTEGTVGFGIDLLGMYGLKLDSSSDRINSGLLPSSGNHVPGVDQAENDYSKATGAVKVKISNTVLKYGGQSVNTPVFATADSRLLPETVEGFFLSSKEVKDLTVEAGHFTSMTLQAYSTRSGSALTGADILGASYKLSPPSPRRCTAHRSRTTGRSATRRWPGSSRWTTCKPCPWTCVPTT